MRDSLDVSGVQNCLAIPFIEMLWEASLEETNG